MEVILFETVPNLGLPGSVVKVAAGYFRNYLSPNGLAVEATAGNIKRLQDKMKQLEKKAEAEIKTARGDAEKLQEVVLAFTLKAGQDDKLFGSVTNIDIAQALEEKGFTVDRHRIVLPEPIKRLGEFKAVVKIHHNVHADVKVIVEKEAEEKAPAETAKTE
jgi:large subunit ribosomal protein L9